MTFSKARTLFAVAVLAVMAACIAVGISTGTLCGIGWGDIAVLCPLGALLAMISARAIIPRAVLSIVLAAVLVVLFGRAFCGWACPVPLLNRAKNFFKPAERRHADEAALVERNQDIAAYEISLGCGGPCAACGSCKQQHGKFDSRHGVFAAAIAASLVFGFPVFCLICPIGLTFGAVSLLVALFGMGDLNWTLLFVPVVLILEMTVLRKWCSRICPVSALLNLGARFSKTAVPVIDNAKCLETSKGAVCSKCATVCKYDVNLRHPEYGELPLHDCARCMECVDACPAKAIAIVPVSRGSKGFAMDGPPAPKD